MASFVLGCFGAHGDLACIEDAAWGRKVIEIDDDLGWSVGWVSWVSWRVAAMVVILVRGCGG